MIDIVLSVRRSGSLRDEERTDRVVAQARQADLAPDSRVEYLCKDQPVKYVSKRTDLPSHAVKRIDKARLAAAL